MPRGVIVDDIVNEIRSLIDEYNEAQVDDLIDILPSLNRGQEKATKVLTRVYPDPLLYPIEIVGVSTREIDMPENVWEDKVVRLEWISNNGNLIPRECQRVDLRRLSQSETGQSTVDRPDCYGVYDQKIRFNGVPNGVHNLRFWVVRETEPLVKAAARITDLDIASNTLYLGELSPTFDPFGSTTFYDWNSYINIIDGQDGTVKGTVQIAGFNGTDTLTIRPVSDRALVMNRTIIQGGLANVLVNADDYICGIKGTCVQYFFDSFHAYCVQYAVAELKRKLGYAYDADQTMLKDFEAELKKTYMGRSLMLRITQNNPNWLKGAQRRFYRGFKY